MIGVVDAWWGGRQMSPMLPRLFFVHFEGTSFVAEVDGELAGFLCGFLSQTHADEAYVHFVGVDPERRGQGIGTALYERFFAEVRPLGRTVVRAVTSPVNVGSVDFHETLGFEIERVMENYDGRGGDPVLLVKRL